MAAVAEHALESVENPDPCAEDCEVQEEVEDATGSVTKKKKKKKKKKKGILGKHFMFEVSEMKSQ